MGSTSGLYDSCQPSPLGSYGLVKSAGQEILISVRDDAQVWKVFVHVYPYPVINPFSASDRRSQPHVAKDCTDGACGLEYP